MPSGYITIKRAAEILGLSVETLRNWDRSGRLPAKRSKINQYRLYSISELERFATSKHLTRRQRPKFKLTKEK